jgi:hypothetical protein
MGLQNVAIVLFAAASFAGCVADTDYHEGPLPTRPAFKPAADPTLPPEVGGSEATDDHKDHPSQHPIVLPLTPGDDPYEPIDGRLVWVEDIAINDGYSTLVHNTDFRTGTDSVLVLDEAGNVVDKYDTAIDPTNIGPNITIR